MSKQMDRNIRKVQRHLYINKQSSRSDIASGTDLSYQQVHRAVNRMLESGLAKLVESEDMRGGIRNKDILELTSEGFQDARNRSLDDDPRVENAEEIEKLKEEVITLNSVLKDIKNDLEEWMSYTSEHTKSAQKRIEALEEVVYYNN
jgi:DNA-binding transcriptional regulator GbsR (MarR family)